MQDTASPQAAKRLVVVGQGAAGLCAAVSALTQARAQGLPLQVTLLDAAPMAASGGNTRWSPSNIRLQANHQMAPGFVDEIMAESEGLADAAYFQQLAEQAPAMADWLVSLGIAFQSPPYYLAKGPARIQPVGGGAALIQAMLAHARDLGLEVIYQFTLTDLLGDATQVTGVAGVDAQGQRQQHMADAVVLACGGFEGNPQMLKTHLGPNAENFRLISQGTAFNDGAGIRAALALGAEASGDWHTGHAEPIDPRSQGPAPVVLVYPYGVVVNAQGERFFDEGAGLMHETWERFSHQMQHDLPEQQAYAILDAKLLTIADYTRAIRSEVPPVSAPSLAALAQALGLPEAALRRTVDDFNAACHGKPEGFDPTVKDGLSCAPVGQPPKSNWARALDQGPYLAWPLVGALVYTFGGVKTNPQAQVLSAHGPVRGLYAAGEVTGHFYRQAPNSVAMLRALVFGKIAGEQAVQACLVPA